MFKSHFHDKIQIGVLNEVTGRTAGYEVSERVHHRDVSCGFPLLDRVQSHALHSVTAVLLKLLSFCREKGNLRTDFFHRGNDELIDSRASPTVEPFQDVRALKAHVFMSRKTVRLELLLVFGVVEEAKLP